MTHTTLCKLLAGMSLFVLTGCQVFQNLPSEKEIHSEKYSRKNPYPNFGSGNGEVPGAEKNFARLIHLYPEAKLNVAPWASSYWPYQDLGIASVQYGGGKSPAGKYDASRGMQTRAEEWEKKHHGKGDDQMEPWWGHCPGWSVASVLFPEPNRPKVVNGVTFTIPDQKALLTEASMVTVSDFFGTRVDSRQDELGFPGEDVIPNQVFLVLTHFMGMQRSPVLIDQDPSYQVWNQPLAGYRFEYPKEEDYLGNSPEAPHIFRQILTFTLWWARDDVTPDAITSAFEWQDNEYFESRNYRMEIWLDGPVHYNIEGKISSSGNLVVVRNGEQLLGGVWKGSEMAKSHPDYLWVPHTILNPADPSNFIQSDPTYVNTEIDLTWIQGHLILEKDNYSVLPS